MYFARRFLFAKIYNETVREQIFPKVISGYEAILVKTLKKLTTQLVSRKQYPSYNRNSGSNDFFVESKQ